MTPNYAQEVYEQVILASKEGRLNQEFLSKYPPDLLYFVQGKCFGKRNDIVQMIAELARKRIADKGFVKCGAFGYFKREDIAAAGLVKKHGDWVYEDDYATDSNNNKKGLPTFKDICTNGKMVRVLRKYKEEEAKEREERKAKSQPALQI